MYKRQPRVLSLQNEEYFFGFFFIFLASEIISSISFFFKLLNVPAADNTVRLAPPLIVSYKEIDKSISIIKKSMKELSK